MVDGRDYGPLLPKKYWKERGGSQDSRREYHKANKEVTQNLRDAYSTFKNLRKSSQPNASVIENADRTLLADIPQY